MKIPNGLVEQCRRVNDKVDAANQRIAELEARLAKADALADALVAHMQWEASIISDDRCWRDECGQPLDLPVLTQSHLDALTPVQEQRNRALAAWQEGVTK